VRRRRFWSKAMLPVPVVSVVAVTAVPRVLLMSRLPFAAVGGEGGGRQVQRRAVADAAHGVEVHRGGRHQPATVDGAGRVDLDGVWRRPWWCR
jgi:hypothetical protein